LIEISTSKAVLILWHFVDECKAVLDALREELRKRDYFPILFDTRRPGQLGTRWRQRQLSTNIAVNHLTKAGQCR
jgi:hypothetical protein